MRLVSGLLAAMFLAVMLAPSSLLAQSRRVRGCIAEATPQGVRMWAVDRDRQAFDSGNDVEPGQGFLLIGDDDLLEEIARREGWELEVTGRLNPEFSSPAIVEPPVFQPPGGGAGWPPQPRGTTRVSGFGTGRPVGPFAEEVPVDVILVEEYRAVGPACRRLERH